ncbi:prolipoprotein diacylglyceryl transferase [Sphingobacterium haloxyli]|uniref:Diacylglyceryl transferase n=1 Tax=Sphingobacterium haloxyli TaxID=2100533 RepID=A0A2S9J998_9SPHI|nr:prolipoprotein diacylglyceryl transferase family protein [Sphingobacterium haloxyli]PRD49334.1 diacylglyceryl transferase [Sphingobacterium haloxyli]
MFPTFSSLINYIFGTDFSWPIPTFGFFVTLAFILSYLVFKSEFGRKEKRGELKAFEEHMQWSAKAISFLFLGYGLLGFLVGYKGIGALLDLEAFSHNPLRFIFSVQGNWTAGLAFVLVACVLTGFLYRKLIFGKNTTETRHVRPKELLPAMLLWVGVTGFIGSKVFNVFEDGHLHHSHSIFEILHVSGLTFWGGLFFGAASYLYIGMRRGMDWRHLTDVGSLGMLVAYGVGRMGCHLSGDGDWGVVNAAEKPFSWVPDWMWSFRFPHNVIGQGEYISGCDGKYCYVLPEGVFPTSFYESFIILLVFAILWKIKERIKTPGRLFVIYLFITGTERFLIEFIRVNYKFNVFGLYLSEAQLVGFFMVLLAFLLGGYLKNNC